MQNIPKAWQIVQKQDGSIEIEVKQVRDIPSLVTALVLTCLWLLAWRPGTNIVHGVTNGNGLVLFGAGCLLALPLAIAYIFYHEEWLVSRDSLTIQKSLFGCQRVRHYRRGHFEFVATEHESGHSWALKVCSLSGGQELARLSSIAELDALAQLLSQQTGWPLREYQGP